MRTLEELTNTDDPAISLIRQWVEDQVFGQVRDQFLQFRQQRLGVYHVLTSICFTWFRCCQLGRTASVQQVGFDLRSRQTH